MAVKKSQLYSSLWSSCDELRGGMDASQYKDYVLTLLFMKYVSDKAENDPNSLIEVPDGGSFRDMVRLKGDKEIGDQINKIIGRLAEENDLKGVIDQADFNDEDKLGRGKEMQDRLSKLVAIFEGLDLGANRAEGDDLLGDAYEYLMRHFATESGKSKGQFYTPSEVSRIMAKVVGIGPDTRPDQSIYDPTCGSGSLLLKAVDESSRGMTIYGQEMDNATWALARMNMILHGHATAELWRGNTLAAPHFRGPGRAGPVAGKPGNRAHPDARNPGNNGLMTFDFAVANPPFSAKAWSTGLDPANDEFGRFAYGIPPAKNGDYAFLLHLITSLKSTGKAAIILPHGVLFRGNREADIRRNLIKQGLIKGIIGLPANLFYGTGIPACIVVIDKQNAQARTGIFMLDASKGFIKDGNKNRLRARDIHKIVDVFNHQIETPGYARMVPMSEIGNAANDYNLNIPRYVDASEAEDLHDLHAHLHGGIPDRDLDALDAYWQVFPSLRETLFAHAPLSSSGASNNQPLSSSGASNNQPLSSNGASNNHNGGYSDARVETSQVKPTILAHPEYQTFAQTALEIFQAWRAAHAPMLKGLDLDATPKAVINTLAEDLLARFAGLPLVDRYGVYQRLMDYWVEEMQDDLYLIAAEGWTAGAKPRAVIDDAAKKIKETPDLTIGRAKYKMDLIAPALLVARYFGKEQAAIDELQAQAESAAQALEEFVEEHTGEEGLLAEATNDKGKLTKGGVRERLKQLKLDSGQLSLDADDDEELAALEQCLELIDAESGAKKTVKEAQDELDRRVLAHYGKLTVDDSKRLVVEDKWMALIRAAIEGEVERLTQRLAGRVRELEERYADPLPVLAAEVETLAAKVAGHLAKMGLAV